MSFKNSKRRSSQTALLDAKGCAPEDMNLEVADRLEQKKRMLFRASFMNEKYGPIILMGGIKTTLATISVEAKTCPRVKTMSLQPLEEMVTCPIDFSFLEDPRLLPCGHVFCCQCLNSYLNQLISRKNSTVNVKINTNTFLPCPLCRTKCPIPESGLARDLPKAFNHQLVLDYIRGQNLFEHAAVQANDVEAGCSSRASTVTNASPLGKRKGSLYVKSDMLKDLVNEIAEIQCPGSRNFLNRAAILEEVHKLIKKMPESTTLPNLVETSMMEPSAPPMPPEEMGATTSPTSQPCRGTSPPLCFKNGGRFHTAASHVLDSETSAVSGNRGRQSRMPSCQSDSEVSPYAIIRDQVSAHEFMRRNAKYRSLRKNQGSCVFPRGISHLCDMHLLPIPGGSHVMRYTLACESNSNIIHLWCKRISVRPERESFMLNNGMSPQKVPETGVYQQLKVDLAQMGSLGVQYVRLYKNKVYLSGIIKEDTPIGDSTQCGDGVDFLPQARNPGVVICCALPEPDNKLAKRELNNSVDSPEVATKKFPIIAMSCLFLRDSVGLNHPNRPTIAGLDIDRDTGDVYVALCANAMVCRLSACNMTEIDREWFLNGPELSPSFICLAKLENEIWASCPLDDKVFILNLATDTFHHFTPSVSFGIIPSHIIYTTDWKILLLDTKLSRVYWFKKVHQTMCMQRIDQSLKERKTRGIEIIQPIDDSEVDSLMATSRTNLFRGGVMCADNEGSYVVYPKTVFPKQKLSTCCSRS